MKTGIELIAQERAEQIEKHNRTTEADVQQNANCELSQAAVLLAMDDEYRKALTVPTDNYCPAGWNIDLWRKMVDKPYKERLIIAGALIAAELDRINS